MKTSRYQFLIQTSTDGSIYAHVIYKGVFVAARTFQPDEPMSAITAWCEESSLWTRDLAFNNANDQISYDHNDGKLHLVGFMGTHETFDPNSDESLAKLVRKLKRTAPIFRGPDLEQPELLPIPTQKDLDRRIIATQIGIPDGLSSSGIKPRFKSQRSAVSREKTQEIVNNILGDLLAGIELDAE